MLMIDSDHEKKSLGIFLITRATACPCHDPWGWGCEWEYRRPDEQWW
jgi:hypothetical protein